MEMLCWCSSKCHMVAMKYICNANFCCLFWPQKWLFIPIEPTNIYLNTFTLMLREQNVTIKFSFPYKAAFQAAISMSNNELIKLKKVQSIFEIENAQCWNLFLKGKCLRDFCSFGGKSAVTALVFLDLYDVRWKLRILDMCWCEQKTIQLFNFS